MLESVDQSAISNGQQRPENVEVKKPGGRLYSQAYKLRILAAADQCARGELIALLRREGPHHSTLRKWRAQRAAGKLDGSY